MSKTLTIHLSDADYQAVRAAAAQSNQSPEELIAATVAERFGPSSGQQQVVPQEDPVIRIMRERGHLVDPNAYPPPPHLPDMPPYGSPEWDQMLEEIGEELSDAVERMGVSLADLSALVER